MVQQCQEANRTSCGKILRICSYDIENTSMDLIVQRTLKSYINFFPASFLQILQWATVYCEPQGYIYIYVIVIGLQVDTREKTAQLVIWNINVCYWCASSSSCYYYFCFSVLEQIFLNVSQTPASISWCSLLWFGCVKKVIVSAFVQANLLSFMPEARWVEIREPKDQASQRINLADT